MPKNYANLPFDQLRRRDRGVEDETWIRDMLERIPFGTLATAHDGQPFINSNLFVYDPQRHCLYMHTANVGRTRANIEANAKVCFSVSEMGRLLPAAEALEFSVEYAGVTVFGAARIIDDPEMAGRALQMLLDRYAPHLKPDRDYRRITEGELKRTAVFQIDIASWTGKRKEVASDFPGAFFFGQRPG